MLSDDFGSRIESETLITAALKIRKCGRGLAGTRPTAAAPGAAARQRHPSLPAALWPHIHVRFGNFSIKLRLNLQNGENAANL